MRHPHLRSSVPKTYTLVGLSVYADHMLYDITPVANHFMGGSSKRSKILQDSEMEVRQNSNEDGNDAGPG